MKLEKRNHKYPGIFRNAWVRHGLFWIIIILFFTTPGIASGELLKGRLLTNLLYVPLDMVAVYISLYVFLPRILRKKLWFSTALMYILMIIVLAAISRYLKYEVYTFLPPSIMKPDTVIGEYFNSAQIINMIVGSALGIKLTLLWYDMQITSQELSRERTEAELAHLRSQLNPHFLFNTLNNIDSLVLRNPEKGSQALIQLSGILRYAVYETRKDRVPLEQEINFLENYIWLQKLRLSKPELVQFEKSGSVLSHEIAPMMLIPIVENAFKHGDKEAGGSGIKISLDIEGDYLSFEVINGIKTKTAEIDQIEGGIGLENLKRRLQLLYPDHYQLTIKPSVGHFFIRLTLNLKWKSNVSQLMTSL